MAKIKEGDRVAYSVQFLASIGMRHGDMAKARGTVSELRSISPGVDSCILARVVWENSADMPERVNVRNLAKVGPNRAFANCD